MGYLLPTHRNYHVISLLIEQQLGPIYFLSFLRDIVPNECAVLASKCFQVLKPLSKIFIFELHLIHLDLIVL
jgi:hypothetical protein